MAAFNFYAVPIFQESFVGGCELSKKVGQASKCWLSPHLAAVITGTVQLLASGLSGLLSDLIGRLPLLLLTSFLMSGALAAFGFFNYYQDSITEYLGMSDRIPLTCVLTFVAAFSLGPNPISWLLVGEMFPLEYRGLGSSLATAFSYICAFVGVKTFVDLKQSESLGLHGTFWTYAILAACGFLFSLAFVPETKGVNLDEMRPKTSILNTSTESEETITTTSTSSTTTRNCV